MHILRFLSIVAISMGSIAAFPQQTSLEEELTHLLAQHKAQVGVAVIMDGKDTVTVHNDYHYPLMSVFKLHQAIAVAQWCEQQHRTLDTLLLIRHEDLKPDTYSPLRDKYPYGNVRLSLSELLKYTLQLSDNNACDYLFRLTGGVKATDTYIRSLGIKDFALHATEDDMHRNTALYEANWSTPLEVARLVEMLCTCTLFDKDKQDFIKQTLMGTRTGLNRLPQPLEMTNAVIGHKTGTGDPNERGQLRGINDVGFVFLPNGRRYSIAVLVAWSDEDMNHTERIIADISKMVFRYMTR